MHAYTLSGSSGIRGKTTFVKSAPLSSSSSLSSQKGATNHRDFSIFLSPPSPSLAFSNRGLSSSSLFFPKKRLKNKKGGSKKRRRHILLLLWESLQKMASLSYSSFVRCSQPNKGKIFANVRDLCHFANPSYNASRKEKYIRLEF